MLTHAPYSIHADLSVGWNQWRPAELSQLFQLMIPIYSQMQYRLPIFSNPTSELSLPMYPPSAAAWIGTRPSSNFRQDTLLLQFIRNDLSG